jgi:hypothetical protein
MYEEITDQFDCIVAEMGSTGTLVVLDQDTVSAVAEGDPDPKFATFVIESGTSKNGRIWSPEIFNKVCEQINNSSEPVVGYLGHIKPEDDGYSFPEIQLQWLKARLNVMSDKCQMYAKAYVLPDTKGREYLSRKLVRTVSWSGKAAMKPVRGGSQVTDFQLESIDLSRPRKAGMSARLVGGLTSEMDEGGTVEPKDIAALTEDELRQHAPLLVKEIETKVRDPLDKKVQEMAEGAVEAEGNASLLEGIREKLGLDEKADVLDVLGSLMTKVHGTAKETREKILDDVLGKKFKDEGTRKLVRRVLVAEMVSTSVAEDKVEEFVNEQINADDDLKRMVDEMEGSGRSMANGSSRRDPRKIEAGYEDDRIRVRKVGARR